MKKITLSLIVAASFLAFGVQDAMSRGGGGRSTGGSRSVYSGSSGRSSKIGPGTGSNTQSHGVRGHVRKDGTYVAPHRQSNPDKSFNNNWSTNPNTNPSTGKQGTRTTPPSE
jgi:hypothetical protein